MIIIDETFLSIPTLLKKERKRRQEPNFNIDELIENQLWEFLYNIGFKQLNVGRQCKVCYGKDTKTLISKNVDIVAESNEARLYIECSTQQDTTSKIKSWIADVDGILRYEGTNSETLSKNVVAVFFTTEDISKQDKLKLREKRISVLNRKVLDYFNELIKLYRNLAYFQFLSYLLNGKVIKSFEKEDFEVPAIRCKYSSKEHCYLFGIQPAKLIPLSAVLHRKMDFEEDISENYQRLVKTQKIKEIKKFISEERGVFPTNIILSFDTKSNDYFKPQGAKVNDIQSGILTLPRQYQSITIIDGQHRLFAYDGLEEAERDLIYVVAFHKLSPEKQIQTFININEKQTKVSPSLMWDLYPSILDPDDIKAKISRIVKKMNKDKNSALFGVIQYDSSDYSSKGSKITLESICTSIKSETLISRIEGIMQINNIKSKNDEFVYSLINNFFNVIQSLNHEHWNRNEKTKNLLRSNQGIGAFIKLLSEFLHYIITKDAFRSNYWESEVMDWYKKLLAPVNKLILTLKTTEEIKQFKRIGEGGKLQIFIDFVKEIHKSFPDFGNAIIEKTQNEELERKRNELLENGEHNTLEAKEAFFTDTKRLKSTGALERNSDDAIRGIVKTVVAFANYKGGEIIVGLNDRVFDYVGIDETDLKIFKDWDTLKQSISQKIQTETVNLTLRPEIIKLTHNSKSFAIIKVNALDKTRFETSDLVVLKNDNNCYKRENGDSIIIPANEITKYCNLVLKEMEGDEILVEEE